MNKPSLAVVVPMLNEEDNVDPLLDQIVAATTSIPLKEIIFVNDGSTDKTLEKMLAAKKRAPALRIVSHSQRCGQSTGVATGVRFATADAIVTLDGDGHNDPADIPQMYELYSAQKSACFIGGQRFNRMDTPMKKLSSKIANRVRNAMLKDGSRDSGCGIKMFPREVFLRLPFFNHMHRFMPALMKREGVTMLYMTVNARPRMTGTSKYGFWDRLWVGIVDLFGVAWLARRGPKPNVTCKEE